MEYYKSTVVYKALEELDEQLYRMKVKPFEINVIGGFALLLENIRVKCDYTDIDYIGKDLDLKIKEVIDEVGIRYKLGRGWVNNDVLLSNSSLEEMEFCTGKLNFKHKFDLKVITVNSLDMKDILKMKVIAIDTSYMALDLGGDFTRTKDFKDIKDLMEGLNFKINDVINYTKDYVLCKEIYKFIVYYNRTGDNTFMLNGNYKNLI